MRRAARIHGECDLRVEWLQDPPPPPAGWVQVRTLCASLCGSDLSAYLHPGPSPLAERHPKSGHLGPFILGHEFVARVVEIGPGVKDLAVGQRVVSGAGWWCGTCPACREGNIHLCQNYFVFGLHADGGLADLVNVPAKLCVPVLDARCSDRAAALAQPCAIAVHAVAKSGLLPSMQLVIFGVGGIGALVLAVARAQGVDSILAVDVNEEHLHTARRLGATATVNGDHGQAVLDAVAAFTGGRGAERIIECTGAAPMPQLALHATRRGGTIHLVGIQKEPIPCDLGYQVTQEIGFTSSNGHHCTCDVPTALHILATTPLAAELCGDEIALEEVVTRGLDPMRDRTNTGKVMINLQK